MKAQTANTSNISFPSTLASKRATAVSYVVTHGHLDHPQDCFQATTTSIPKDAFDMDKRASTSVGSDTLYNGEFPCYLLLVLSLMIK